MKRNILEYLESSAGNYPQKIAFSDEKKSCTYKELEEISKMVGTYLSLYVDGKIPIPVFLEKGVNTIYGFMGAVYAGCFYVLLDPKLPSERIRQILEVLEADIILTSAEYKQQSEDLQFSGTILYIEDAINCHVDKERLLKIKEQRLDIDPLYVMFTSGSTGTPKGVVVSHRSVIDFIEDFTDLFHITDKDVIGNQAPFDFDVSVKDIYSTITVGATMQIIPKNLFSFPTKLLDYMIEREVTTLIWAVSALCIITTLKGFEYKVPERINKVIFSGEVMPIKHLNKWKEYLPNAMYVNVYGPTEITCNCVYYIVNKEYSPGDILPIGKAFPNEKVFLLDEHDKMVDVRGKEGEICVSGTALSLGYYNNKEQTEKVFTQNPLNTSYLEPIYRTGDMAYYNEEHDLCFTSRKDFQIKHMGHRIEMSEIMVAMEKLDGVERSCCVFDERKKKIIAFYEGKAESRQIVKGLRIKLPSFMLPNVFCQVQKFPLTKNGKIDRVKLQEQYLEGEI